MREASNKASLISDAGSFSIDHEMFLFRLTLMSDSSRLFNLPDEISELENLTHLDLSGNDFTSVPWCLYRMPQLRFLNLSNNNIVGKCGSLAS